MSRNRIPFEENPTVELSLYTGAFAVPTWNVHKDCVTELGANLYTPYQTSYWVGSQLNWGAKLASSRTAVICQGTQLAGFVGLMDDGCIDQIAVAPEMSRRGLGTVLLAWAIREALFDGMEEVFTVASPLARPLFQKLGFIIEKELRMEIHGTRIKSYSMSLDLLSKCIEQADSIESLVPDLDLKINAKPHQKMGFWSRKWRVTCQNAA
jgi:Acetyltransferases